MGLFKKLLGGGATSVMEAGGEILKAVDGLTVDPEEKSLIRRDVLTTLVDAQAAVIQAEYQHGTWLSRSWRPLVMLSFAGIVIYQYFIGPMFNLKLVTLPPEMWTLLQVGIGGYIGTRSLEKVVTTVAPSLKLAKMKKKLLAKGIDPRELEG